MSQAPAILPGWEPIAPAATPPPMAGWEPVARAGGNPPPLSGWEPIGLASKSPGGGITQPSGVPAITAPATGSGAAVGDDAVYQELDKARKNEQDAIAGKIPGNLQLRQPPIELANAWERTRSPEAAAAYANALHQLNEDYDNARTMAALRGAHGAAPTTQSHAYTADVAQGLASTDPSSGELMPELAATVPGGSNLIPAPIARSANALVTGVKSGFQKVAEPVQILNTAGDSERAMLQASSASNPIAAGAGYLAGRAISPESIALTAATAGVVNPLEEATAQGLWDAGLSAGAARRGGGLAAASAAGGGINVGLTIADAAEEGRPLTGGDLAKAGVAGAIAGPLSRVLPGAAGKLLPAVAEKLAQLPIPIQLAIRTAGNATNSGITNVATNFALAAATGSPYTSQDVMRDLTAGFLQHAAGGGLADDVHRSMDGGRGAVEPMPRGAGEPQTDGEAVKVPEPLPETPVVDESRNPPIRPAPPPVDPVEPIVKGEWTKDRITGELEDAYRANRQGDAVANLRDAVHNQQVGIHPDDFERMSPADKKLFAPFKSEEGWSNRPMTEGEMQLVREESSGKAFSEAALDWARHHEDPAVQFMAWMHDQRTGGRKGEIDISSPEKVDAMLGKSWKINGKSFRLLVMDNGDPHLVDDDVEFPAADRINGGRIPFDAGTIQDDTAKPTGDVPFSPADEERRPLTGQQKGLLGERFDGPVAGSKSGNLFGDASQGPASPIEGQPEQTPLEKKFKDTPTGELFSSPDDAMEAPQVQPAGRVHVDPITGAGAKPPHDIILDASKDLGVNVRVARGERRSKGVYYPGSARTSIRFHGDMDTAAHEVAHALDDKFDVVGAWAGFMRTSPYDAELSPFAKFGSKPPRGSPNPYVYRRAEGVAEWVRAWMVNPAEAEKQAPTFAAYFKSKVPPKALEAVRRFGDDIRQWAGSTSTEKTASNIRSQVQTPTIAERMRGLKDATRDDPARLKYTLMDQAVLRLTNKNLPIEKAISVAEHLKGISNLPPSKDPAKLLVLNAGVQGKIREIFESGPVVSGTPGQRAPGIGGGVDWLLEPLDHSSVESLQRDQQLLEALLVSQRTLEKSQQITKSRISGAGGGIFRDTDIADETIKELAADPAKFAKLQEAATRYRAWANAVMEYAKDNSLVSPDDVQRMRDANTQYADMHRVMEEIEPGYANRGSGGLASGKKVTDRFKGSTRQIESPIVNLLMQTYSITRKADANNIMLSIRDLLKPTRGMYGGDVQDLQSIGSQAKAGDPGTIPIYTLQTAKGQTEMVKEHWQFEPLLHRTLEGYLSHPDLGFLAKFSRAATGIFRTAVTHAPQFAVRNVIRDTVNRAVVSESGGNPLYRNASEDDVRLWRLMGGDQADRIYGSDLRVHKFLKGKIRDLAQDKNTLLTLPQNLAKLYVDVVKGSEKIGRTTEYKNAFDKAKAAGMSDHDAAVEAAYHARDLLDYARVGTWVEQTTKYIPLPFFNANIQGPARAVRGFMRNPSGFAVKALLYSVLPTLGVYAWNARDKKSLDEYRQLPSYRRDYFWNFHLPTGQWLSIPKPFEIGAMSTGFERVIDSALGNKHAFEGYPTDLKNAFLPSVDRLTQGPLPLSSEIQNYDNFRQKAIVPPDEVGKDLSLRHTESASRIGKLLQDVLHIDARLIDHAGQSLFGGVGQTTEMLSDVGRDDKRAGRYAQLTGVVAQPSTYDSPDVQFVLKEAERVGDSQSFRVRLLKQKLAQEARDPDAQKRDDIRRMASEFRQYYEERGQNILQRMQRRQDVRSHSR